MLPPNIPTTNETTLSRFFTRTGPTSWTGFYGNLHNTASTAEGIVTAIVADGLSRVSATDQALFPSLGVSAPKNTRTMSKFFFGQAYTLPPPREFAITTSNRTELTGSVTITRMAYRIGDVTAALALALLYVYFAVALAHAPLDIDGEARRSMYGKGRRRCCCLRTIRRPS